MAFVHEFLPQGSVRHLFDIPRFRKTGKGNVAPHDAEASARDLTLECEFSEVGRDPRFPHGWYIVPGALLGVLLILALLL